MKPNPQQARWVNALYARLVYPLVNPRVYGRLSKRMKKYEQLERLPLAENRELQWRALVRLLQHAYDTTSLYRHRFETAGLRPSEITSPSDLERIPPLTREDIREHFPELQSDRYRTEDLCPAATGGTIDTPIPLLRSRGAIREKMAVQWRLNNWAGFHPGDKVFYVWGARQDFSENPSWRWRLYDRHLMRQVWAPTSLFNEDVLEGYRQSLNRFKPRIVYAYPTPLALFCEYLRASGKLFHRPVSAICTAEPLLEDQRRMIEEVLGCPVFEHYGSREFAMIAGECERHQGMHLNPAAAYVEFVPMRGAEVEGLQEILVTDLLNYGMPLIRYRINDCGLLGPESCACGRGYPLIRQITGRTTDVFCLPNGDLVPGVALTNRVLQVCPGLKKVQVIQETQQDFRVRYVPGPGFGQADLDLLKTNLRRFIPDGVEWTFEPVADIQRERSGKTRFCISHVGKPATRGGERGAG
jgi:phenylacetate-CoA ligase